MYEEGIQLFSNNMNGNWINNNYENLNGFIKFGEIEDGFCYFESYNEIIKLLLKSKMFLIEQKLRRYILVKMIYK
jgi:hypothetical protein